jgi:hypothetical protein
MLAFLLVGLQAASTSPPNPQYDYSGLPAFAAPSSALTVRSHSVTLEVGNDFVDVSTVSELRNLTNGTLAVRVTIPRYRHGDAGATSPTFDMKASVNGHALTLRQAFDSVPIVKRGKGVFVSNPLQTTLYLAKNTSYGLRTSYRVPVGRAGFDRKLRLVGYSLDPGRQIDNLVISYRTASGVVFRLPRPNPDLGWQVGSRGAFVKRTKFQPAGELTYVTYYPGGFEDIGG